LSIGNTSQREANPGRAGVFSLRMTSAPAGASSNAASGCGLTAGNKATTR
jgi:hypothetical protein